MYVPPEVAAAQAGLAEEVEGARRSLTREEREDVRFALGHCAAENRARAESAVAGLGRTLIEQAERFERLAREVSKW